MGNEQTGIGTSHHFKPDNGPNDERQRQKQAAVWTKNGRIPPSRTSIGGTKPSWQIARDLSTELLSRKATKLSLKQGPTPYPTGPFRSVAKKFPPHATPSIGQPTPIYKTPRMPTDKEAAEVAIAYELMCDFCGDPCIGNYLRCRVCIKTYHSNCLYQRGHIADHLFTLPRLSKQDWSCPDCRDLTQLLSHDEIVHLMNAFDHIDRNKDGYIILDEFLPLQWTKSTADTQQQFLQHSSDMGKIHFALMDSMHKGAIAWSDFSLFYSCKFIAEKNKAELSAKLSVKELVMAKNYFLKDPRGQVDSENNKIITREHHNRVFCELKTMLRKKYGNKFIDAVLGEENDDPSVLSVVSWDEYLRQISVLMLLNRVNDDVKISQPRRASIPAHLATTPAVVSHTMFAPTDSEMMAKKRASIITPIIPPEITVDESFRKHARLMTKLNEQSEKEELKRKKMGSSIDWCLVEDVDENDSHENFTPKLKHNARDGRQSIVDPWSVVKELEQLRNEPILVTTTRLHMLHV